jgi:hypothetical protein
VSLIPEQVDETSLHKVFRVKDGAATRVILEPKNNEPSVVFSLTSSGILQITLLHEHRNTVHLSGTEVLETVLRHLKG